jgi:drug/metabolite transporter (DMT)-like permease
MRIFLYIIMPIITTVCGEFLLKIAVGSTPLSFGWDTLVLLYTSPLILAGVALILLSATLWVMGMSRFQLSFMYPFLSINYVIIVVGSEWLLGEDVRLNRYIAMGLIIVGLVIISKSNNRQIQETAKEISNDTTP